MKGLITNYVIVCMKYNITLFTIYVILHMNIIKHHWSTALMCSVQCLLYSGMTVVNEDPYCICISVLVLTKKLFQEGHIAYYLLIGSEGSEAKLPLMPKGLKKPGLTGQKINEKRKCSC